MRTKTDIKLPPLPGPTLEHPTGDLKFYGPETLEEYARAAVMADRKTRWVKERGQLEAEWLGLRQMKAAYEADRQGRMPSDDERGTSDPIAGLPRAQSVSDEMMDLVDRLGSEYDEVDPRAWEHLLVYAPRLSRYGSSQPVASARTDKMVWCACGDGYPADSYGAGFIDAAGHCENCDAAEHAVQEAASGEPVRVDCGECPNVSAGCEAGKCLHAAPVAQEPVAWANWKVGTKSYVPYRTEAEASASVRQSEIAATQDGPYRVVSLGVIAAPTPPAVEQSNDQDFKGLLAAIRYELGLVGTDGETILSIGARRTLRWADAQISQALDSDIDAPSAAKEK